MALTLDLGLWSGLKLGRRLVRVRARVRFRAMARVRVMLRRLPSDEVMATEIANAAFVTCEQGNTLYAVFSWPFCGVGMLCVRLFGGEKVARAEL